MSRAQGRENIVLAVLMLCMMLLFGFPAASSYAGERTGLSVTHTHRLDSSPASNLTPTLVLLTDSLTWKDVDPTTAPYLWQWASSGTMFDVVLPNISGWNCPEDFALAIGAASAVSDDTVNESALCQGPDVTAGAHMAEIAQLIDNSSASDDSHPVVPVGMLGQVLKDHGVSPFTIGQQAAVLALDAEGAYPDQWVAAPLLDSTLGDVVRDALATHSLVIVDSSTTAFSSDPARRKAAQALETGVLQPIETDPQARPTLDVASESEARAQTSARSAERLNAVLEKIQPGTRVMLVSLMDLRALNGLQPAFISYGTHEDSGADASSAMAHAQLGRGGLGWSPQTRQDGVVSYMAVAPTLLHMLNIADTDHAFGGGVSVVDADDAPAPESDPTVVTDTVVTDAGNIAATVRSFDARAQQLNQLSAKAETVMQVRSPFYRTMWIATISFVLVSTLWFVLLRLIPRTPTRWLKAGIHTALIAGGLTISAVPVASHLVTMLYPWWMASNPTRMLLLATWGSAAFLALLAACTLRRHAFMPITAIAALTSLLLTIDVATGSHVLADSPMGFNTLLGARFYGLGNEGFALVATGAFFALGGVAALMHRRGLSHRMIAAVTAMLGLIVAVIDVWPTMGADFGGALSFVPALAVFVLLVARVRISAKTAGLGSVFAVILAAGAALADWMRPVESRTHLGNFVQSIVDGDAGAIVVRKLSVNLHLLVSSTHRWVVLVGMVFILLVLVPVIRQRAMTLRSSYLLVVWFSAAVCLVIAALVNDSGIVLPGMGCILALPGIIAGLAYETFLSKESGQRL